MDATLPTSQQDELLEFFKVFSNLERLQVAGLLASEKLTAGKTAEHLGWSLPNTLKHLDFLEHAGYLKTEAADVQPVGARSGKEASERVYRLDADALHQMSRRVLAGSRPRVSKEDFEGEDYDRKVLSDYIAPGGALRSIPMQRKKLLAILRHVVQVFEAGQKYPEKQVNEMLRRFHPDTAMLRRSLVDEHMLERKDGVYWKV